MTHAGAPSRLQLTRLSDLTPTQPRLEWGGRLVANKINNLQGEGGLGKTFIAIDIAARWTTGQPFPGHAHGDNPGTVLYFSAEDGAADTLLPRLTAAGGDPERFYVSNATLRTESDGTESVAALSLQQVTIIRTAVREVRPSLLIVDPVTSFLGGGVDMHRANEVRPILEAFNQLAEEEGVTILFILHVNKSSMQGGQAAYRALGTVDFVNVARSILVVGEHEERKVLAHAKMNLSEKAESLFYELEPSPYKLGGRPVARIAWKGGSELTAEDVVGAARSRGGPTATFQPEEIAEQIVDALSTPLTAQQLERYVRDDLGVSKHAYEAARSRLRDRGAIQFRRHGFGEESRVYWYRTDRPAPWSEAGQ